MTERVRLNLRVPPKAKEAFDNALIDKFGKKMPYGGVELERELRTVLDEGALAELRETVEEVAEIFGKEDREEKTRSLNGSGSALVQYRIHEDVREEIKRLAENSDYRSAGRFVGGIMMTYALEGGVVGRLTDKLERVKKAAEREVDSTIGPKERRTNSIVEELAGKSQFDLYDFDQAVDEEARGIGSGKHARKEYLPRVLNELGYTWSPTGEEIFVDPSAADIPDTRDPTTKPYYLMDEEDKRLALKFEAYRNAVSSGNQIFEVTDGEETLDGKPSQKTVRRLLRDIAECSPGFDYTDSKEEPLVRVNQYKVKDAPEKNSRILEIGAEMGDLDTDQRGWVGDAANRIRGFCNNSKFTEDDVSLEIIDNKIARAKYPDKVVDYEIQDDALERVTEEEREIVLRRLGVEERIENIEEKLDELSADGDTIVADGGKGPSE